jgi:glycosyltransferase involved in cell wall biosynthesis
MSKGRRRRVLVVTSSYPKYPGDVTAPFIESISRGVASRGHRVDVVLPHHPELRRGADEPLRFFPFRYAPREDWNLWGYAQSLRADVSLRSAAVLVTPLAALALRRGVAERLRERSYDVLHVHWVVPNAALIADLARAHRTPMVVSLHGSDVFLPERIRPLRPLARAAFRRAAAVTACSADLHRRAVALGAPPQRTATVPYGVDLESFSPAPRGDRGAVRSSLGATPDGVLVLAVGRLVEKKGFRHLIDAAARCPVQLAIAGAGDLEAELRERARQRNAPVRFVGPLERADVAAALAAADVVAVPSVRDAAGNVDGLPNVLLEAMASGRAVVASRVAGIPDVVRDGDDGLLVPPGDALALAAALSRLAADPAERERLGRAARSAAETRFSWESATDAFEESYERAAALDAG